MHPWLSLSLLKSDFSSGAECRFDCGAQVGQGERLGKAGTLFQFQKMAHLWVDDVAGNENDAPAQVGRCV